MNIYDDVIYDEKVIYEEVIHEPALWLDANKINSEEMKFDDISENSFMDNFSNLMDVEDMFNDREETTMIENRTQYLNIEDILNEQQNLKKYSSQVKEMLSEEKLKLERLKIEMENTKNRIEHLKNISTPKEFTTNDLIRNEECESLVIAMKNISDSMEKFILEIIDCTKLDDERIKTIRVLQAGETIRFVLANVPEVYRIVITMIEGSCNITIAERTDNKNTAFESSRVLLNNVIRSINSLRVINE